MRLDTSYLDAITSSGSNSSSSSSDAVISTTVVKIQATANIVTYMPSSKGSTRSLSCGCSSASCCSVTTYERDSQSLSHSPVSASSPNLSYGGPPTPMVSNHEALNTSSLTPGTSKAPSTVRVIHPNELAKRMTCCPMGHPVGPVPVIIDCRTFMDYNKSHIRGAVHINCSDKISRRRLQQGKITVLDLISCREGKDSYKGIFSKEIVVYDESTADPNRLTFSQPLYVVLESLRREGKDPIILKGTVEAGGVMPA